MQIFTEDFLDGISRQAKASPRLRMNYNLHDSLEAKAQRLFNALEPGTELPIHRHTHTSETYVLLRGRLRIMFYDDNRQLVDSCELNPKEGNYGVHIPAGQWHTIEVLESGTVILEVKDGPYTPLTPDNIMTI